MKKYAFHWLDGKVENGEGANVADALTKLGYGGGALSALDHYEQVKRQKTVVAAA